MMPIFDFPTIILKRLSTWILCLTVAIQKLGLFVYIDLVSKLGTEAIKERCFRFWNPKCSLAQVQGSRKDYLHEMRVAEPNEHGISHYLSAKNHSVLKKARNTTLTWMLDIDKNLRLFLWWWCHFQSVTSQDTSVTSNCAWGVVIS
jgi:hypothetical protein